MHQTLAPMRNLLHLLLLLTFITACADNEPTSGVAKLQGSIAGATADSVFILGQNLMSSEPYTLASAPITADGEFVVQVPLKQGAEHVLLRVGRSTLQLFLSPNDEVMLAGNSDNLPVSAKYSGKGSDANEAYMYLAKTMDSLFNSRGGPEFFALEPVEFEQKLEENQAQIEQIWADYKKGKGFSQRFTQIAEAEIAANRVNMLLVYPYFYANANGREPQNLPDTFDAKNLADQLPTNKQEWLGSPTYRILLERWVAAQQEDIARSTSQSDKVLPELYNRLNAQIDEPKVKEYLLAKLIYAGYQQAAVAPAGQLYKSYKTEYADSPFLESLSEMAGEWEPLAPGADAPDFKAVTAAGDTVSLSDLRGKVVYADLWATWCAPCLAEMPASHALREEFAGNDEVVFLYVSIDEKKNRWLDYLDKHPEMEGAQWYVNNAWNSGLAQEYKVNFIPRYLLINKQGKLVSAMADRPSGGTMAAKLRELLGPEV